MVKLRAAATWGLLPLPLLLCFLYILLMDFPRFSILATSSLPHAARNLNETILPRCQHALFSAGYRVHCVAASAVLPETGLPLVLFDVSPVAIAYLPLHVTSLCVVQISHGFQHAWVRLSNHPLWRSRSNSLKDGARSPVTRLPCDGE